jgi:flagellar basal body-associated protein FliL
VKLVVILLVIVLLLGGGGVGALYFLELGPFEPPPAEEGAEPEKPESSLVDLSNTSFLDMDTLVIPIIGKDRTRSYYLDIRLELNSPNRAAAAQQKVRLHDAFLRDMFVFLPQHLERNPTVNLHSVKSRFVYIAQQILGEELVRDVLIQSAYER